MDENEISRAIASAMGRIQHLTIESNYDNVKTLTAVLEQLQWAREESRKAWAELERLRNGRKPEEEDGPGGGM